MDAAGRTAGVLWAVARPEVRPDEVGAAVDRAVEAGVGGGTVVDAALRHRLGPLLWRGLTAAGRVDALGSAAGRLAADAHLRRQEELLLHPHALALGVDPLRAAGLEPIVFKGPALATRYPAPGLRPMVDIDLLLPPAAHAAAVAALAGAGWAPLQRPGRSHYDTPMTHPDVPGLVLEVHQGLDVWYDRANKETIGDLWDVRIPIRCMGTDAFGLPVEAEVVALAAHAGKPFHVFAELIWATDVVVAASAGVDWDRVEELAAAWRCRTVLAVSLAHASRLGLDAPPRLLRTGASRRRQRALQPLLDDRWPATELTNSLRTRLRYALVDDPGRRAALWLASPAQAPAWQWPGRLVFYAGRTVWRAWRLRRGGSASRPAQ